MNTEERNVLTKEIEKHYTWFNTGSHLWSTAHHGSLYLAAILSTATALILKLESFKDLAFRADLAAILSAIAALFGTLAAAGGFQRKWKSNRLNRGKLNQLLVDLTDSESDAKKIRNQLKDIIADHDKVIIEQK